MPITEELRAAIAQLHSNLEAGVPVGTDALKVLLTAADTIDERWKRESCLDRRHAGTCPWLRD